MSPPVLTANSQDRSVSWDILTDGLTEQYLLINDVTTTDGDMTRMSLLNTATSASLNDMLKTHKYLVVLEQVTASSVIMSNTATLNALSLPFTPTISSVAQNENKNGLVVNFSIPNNSPVPTTVAIVVSTSQSMTTAEIPFSNATTTQTGYSVNVTNSDANIIEDNVTFYEVSMFSRNDNGDSDLSNTISTNTKNLPNAPVLNSVVVQASGSAQMNWSAPDDINYWTTTSIQLYVQEGKNALQLLL